MNIVEALQVEFGNARLSVGDKWLFWNSVRRLWIVYQRKYGARKTVVLFETESEEEAVAVLMKGE